MVGWPPNLTPDPLVWNEEDAVGVNENDSQTLTKSETRPKKRKADCLQESKDIPSFEEAEFSGE